MRDNPVATDTTLRVLFVQGTTFPNDVQTALDVIRWRYQNVSIQLYSVPNLDYTVPFPIVSLLKGSDGRCSADDVVLVTDYGDQGMDVIRNFALGASPWPRNPLLWEGRYEDLPVCPDSDSPFVE